MYRIIAATLCALLLGGCVSAGGELARQTGIRAEPTTPSTAGATVLREHRVDLIQVLETALGDTQPAYPGGSANAHLSHLILKVDLLDDRRQQQKIRNSVVGQLVDASVKNCSVYLQSLRGGQVAARTTFDILASGLGLAGGIATPERSAKLLSSLGAMATATGAAVDRNIFAEQGVELVAEEIEKVRDRRWQELSRKTGLPYQEWSLGFALADIDSFHHDCSMLKGLGLMRDAVVTRDLLVKAARLSAAKAAREGASGLAVAAAIAGLEEAALGEDAAMSDVPADRTPAIATSSAAEPLDLEVKRNAALACLDKLAAKLETDDKATPTSLLKDGAFQKAAGCGEADWAGRYAKLALDAARASEALTSAQTFTPEAEAADRKTKTEGLTKAKAAVPPLQTAHDGLQHALDVAKAASDAAPANEDLKAKFTAAQTAAETGKAALERAKAAQTQAEADLKASEDRYAKAFAEGRPKAIKATMVDVKATATKKIELDMGQVTVARGAALQFGLGAAEKGATALQVTAAMERVAGDFFDPKKPEASDPVLSVMIETARRVANTPESAQSGMIAARAAQAAAQAYVANADALKS